MWPFPWCTGAAVYKQLHKATLISWCLESKQVTYSALCDRSYGTPQKDHPGRTPEEPWKDLLGRTPPPGRTPEEPKKDHLRRTPLLPRRTHPGSCKYLTFYQQAGGGPSTDRHSCVREFSSVYFHAVSKGFIKVLNIKSFCLASYSESHSNPDTQKGVTVAQICNDTSRSSKLLF